MDAQLRKIEEIEKQKDEEEELRYFEKYSHIFQLTFEFLHGRNVLMYGGMAINELLPQKLKFYNAKALPDIDVLTVRAEKLAKDCVTFFQKKGYRNITTSHSEALHPGTYKVYVDSLQVLDITRVSEKAYKRLSKHAVFIEHHKLYVVDPQYLRMTLHLILSKGDAVTVHRWGKALERLVAFYKTFPPKPCDVDKSIGSLNKNKKSREPVPDTLYEDVYNILRDTEYVHFGIGEIEKVTGKKIPVQPIVPRIQLLADDNVDNIARVIVEKLQQMSVTNNTTKYNPKRLKISRIYPADNFVQEHIVIMYGTIPVVVIFRADTCEGFSTYKNIRIASVHTIIRMGLSIMFSSYSHLAPYSSVVECIVNMLTLVSNKDRLKPRHKKLLEDVVKQCYGSSEGLVTMRKNRILRLKNNNLLDK
jgi:hypothetical protein